MANFSFVAQLDAEQQQQQHLTFLKPTFCVTMLTPESIYACMQSARDSGSSSSKGEQYSSGGPSTRRHNCVELLLVGHRPCEEISCI
jgi:hypothetical protein